MNRGKRAIIGSVYDATNDLTEKDIVHNRYRQMQRDYSLRSLASKNKFKRSSGVGNLICGVPRESIIGNVLYFLLVIGLFISIFMAAIAIGIWW